MYTNWEWNEGAYYQAQYGEDSFYGVDVCATPDASETVTTAGVDEVSEHPGPPYGRELMGVADEHDPPLLPVGQRGELREFGGGDHAGLVDQQRRPAGQLVAAVGRSRGVGVFVEEFVDWLSVRGAKTDPSDRLKLQEDGITLWKTQGRPSNLPRSAGIKALRRSAGARP